MVSDNCHKYVRTSEKLTTLWLYALDKGYKIYIEWPCLLATPITAMYSFDCTFLNLIMNRLGLSCYKN